MKQQVRDVMTRVVEYVTPDAPVRDVATRMKDRDIGSFPVCVSGAIVGMVTDRDLVLRVLAEGRDPAATPVRDVMSKDIVCCDLKDRLDDVVALMSDRQVRRIPVVSQGSRLVGLVTLGMLAEMDGSVSGKVLKDMVQPSVRQRA